MKKKKKKQKNRRGKNEEGNINKATERKRQGGNQGGERTRSKRRKEKTSTGVYATHPPGDLPLSLFPFFLCISVMLGLFATTL